MTDDTLPDRQEEIEGGTVHDESEPPASRSLTDGLTALYDDGKTYAEAELNFQKSRASFAGGTLGSGIGFVLAALAFLHLALIALVVGLVIALAPVVGIWGAIAIVVGTLLVGVIVFALIAKKRFTLLSNAFAEK